MSLVLLKLSSRLNHFCFHHLNLLLNSRNQWLLQMLLSLNQWFLQMFLWSQMFPYNNPSLLLLPQLSRHRRDALKDVFPLHQRSSTYMVIKCRWAISLPYYVAITNSNRNYWFKNWGIGILSWPPPKHSPLQYNLVSLGGSLSIRACADTGAEISLISTAALKKA